MCLCVCVYVRRKVCLLFVGVKERGGKKMEDNKNKQITHHTRINTHTHTHTHTHTQALRQLPPDRRRAAIPLFPLLLRRPAPQFRQGLPHDHTRGKQRGAGPSLDYTHTDMLCQGDGEGDGRVGYRGNEQIDSRV